MNAEVITIAFRNVNDASKCHRKQASRVTRHDGKSITFTDKMSKREAIRQAQQLPEDCWK